MYLAKVRSVPKLNYKTNVSRSKLQINVYSCLFYRPTVGPIIYNRNALPKSLRLSLFVTNEFVTRSLIPCHCCEESN